MPVDDLARSDVVTADPATGIADLAATMDEEDVGSIVVTEDGVPTGIVTDRDLTVRVLAEAADPTDRTAADVMTSNPFTVERGAGFYEAAALMAEHGIRRLPVCEGDELVGIITADDLTELLADEQQRVAEILQAQRPEY